MDRPFDFLGGRGGGGLGVLGVDRLFVPPVKNWLLFQQVESKSIF